MNSKIKSGIIFLSGLISGAVGMFAFIKAKWQKEFEAKRDEMIAYYQKKKPEIPKKETKPKDNSDELKDLKKVINKCNYSEISSPSGPTKNLSPILNDDYSETPYAIDSREFGTQEMYGMVTFYLHDDGEIVTEKYEPLDDESIETYIGRKNLEILANARDSEPDMDSYYIRNDRLKLDIEILIEPEGKE